MGDLTEDEKMFYYGDENGRGAWWDEPYDPREDEDPDDVEFVAECQNCDYGISRKQARHGSLYCSEKCSQMAHVIRYARGVLKDPQRREDPLVQRAITMQIAHTLAGGYSKRARVLTPERREEVFTRDAGVCRICGGPATEIDHIHGSSSDLENLQAVCRNCNMAKAEANFRPATLEEQVEGNAIMVRIHAPAPLRLCDDHEQWPLMQKGLARQNREAAKASAFFMYAEEGEECEEEEDGATS